MGDLGDEIEDMRDELQKSSRDSNYQSTRHAMSSSSQLPPPSAFDDTDNFDGDNYAAFEQQRQVEIMQEQDQALDGVFKTVGNLRQQADEMGRELDDQAEMLEDTGQMADRVGGKLKDGMKRVGYILKKNEGNPISQPELSFYLYILNVPSDTMSSCCIAVLIFVLILLLVLVLIL